jgi:hypothetical protein
MSDRRVAGALRRLAADEVERVDLWPALRSRLERQPPPLPSASSSSTRADRGGSPIPGVDTAYHWSADDQRRSRRTWSLAALSAAGLILALILTAGLIAVLVGGSSPNATPTAALSGGTGNPLAATPAATALPLAPVEPRVAPPPYPTPASCNVSPYASSAPSGHYGTDYTTTWFGGDGLWAGLDRAYGGNWYAGGLKVMWLREAVGSLTIIGYPLDSPGPTVTADVPAGYGASGLQASGIDFPVAGCWKVVATVDGHQLDFVVYAYPSGCREPGWANDPATPQPCAPPAADPQSVVSTCPVTPPPSPPFVPPAPEPAVASGREFRYGTAALWTALPNDGIWSGLPDHAPQGYTQKVFWWSTGYHGEASPELAVSGRQLDGTAALQGSSATNAFASDIGSAMLVGVDFPTTGCWEITGTFEGHTLSFVVWVGDPAPAKSSSSLDIVVAPLALALARASRSRRRRWRPEAVMISNA